MGRASGLERDLGMLWKVLGESLGWHWEALETLWELFGHPLEGLGSLLGTLGSLFGEVFLKESMLHDFCSIFE